MKFSMPVLVIGTSGQLATELHRAAPRLGVALMPSVKIDLTASTLVGDLDALRPDIIVNAAAYTAVDRAESEPEQAFAVNAHGPRTLAEWCSRRGAALVHVSTDYVFDGTKDAPYREEDATAPLGVYGASKLAGEEAVSSALDHHMILRTSWVFSAIGHNFVKTMLRLARERDELRVVADQFGKPTSAAELARVILTVAPRLHDPGFPYGTYHCACPSPTSWYEFAQAIVDEQALVTNKRPKVTAIGTADYPTPARRPANSVLDCSRLERAFGITLRGWRQELAATVGELTSAPR